MPHGSEPGERRGGRQKGTPNRRTFDVMEKLAALGCDPVEGMARIAMDETNPADLRGRMFAELAAYVAPKRKAVDHSVSADQQITVQIVRLCDDPAPE